MSDVTTTQANRLRRPSWKDSRLLVGLLLVLLSTALGGFVVSRAEDTVPVYAAKADLVPGQALGDGDVERVDVRLGDTMGRYLSAEGDLPAGLHALRAIGGGELISRSSVGDRERVDTRVVSVLVDSVAATSLAQGSLVDVYVNRPTGTTGPGGRPVLAGPERRLERATVAAVPEEGSVLGGISSQVPIQLIVPTSAVQGLVEDIDLAAKITLVPVPGDRAGAQG